MAGDTRMRMIRQAAKLFRGQGYAATGFREIVEKAETHRGVIYHHFPRGKAELAEEVVRLVDGTVGPAIEAVCANQEPVSAMRAVLAGAKMVMTGGGQRPGCPIAAVALGAGPGDAELLTATRDVFRQWQVPFRDCLRRNGFEEADATNLATLLIAGLEGALVLCRTEGDTEPLDRVADALERALRP
ncbi:TetR/AcrR family transcriptional regulator [Nocardia seriolae]|uniref:HTH-type transcriptional regulator YxaF n=1 Tax=Nocardia seriolae TaxID=37332 RepID=A0ABC8AWB6_9NOCA|nr:TetR/AcrR family transcriptional regulator [Nocardia seriolae]APA98469.1 putative HTH-type transcriptional regulator YxaF [Nocardia seriolae]MTJ64072.1 TetR family transcriptional regulator [Nocardia seriolae]MTJ74348.1 TetR family transcriptional regulator [Nocardia seriolae]MTJ88149.1 TetR family transcriptional regulator [Nocardia seriolae]MTK32138.1 TetR family transcriptional regulator [Nocardia seriolae]